MVALSLFSIDRLKNYIYYSDQMDHTNFIITQLYKTQVNLAYVDRAERGYMITKDTIHINHIKAYIDSVKLALNQLDTLVADSTQLQQDITTLRKEVDNRITAVFNNISYVDSSKSSVNSKYFENSRAGTRECSKLLKKMNLNENSLLQERFNSETFYKDLISISIKYLLVIFCVVTFVLFLLLLKELIVRMRYQEQLQEKLIDLRRSHNELEEIAYVTSHDLQEPLRKIQVFSNLLTVQHKEKIDPDVKNNLERINSAAKSMQLMISALMKLSSLSRNDEKKVSVKLNLVFDKIIQDLNDQIIEKNAVITIANLPVIAGYESQLKILFTELIENSLMFSNDNISPTIQINCSLVKGKEIAGKDKLSNNNGYYKIDVIDNGIGFDNQYITKIFRIFQKLQTDINHYEGKGIGLAICQRIMANHDGFIVADGKPSEGATFSLYFPVNSNF